MKMGIIGLNKSGKTTIFNALTGQKAETADYSSGKLEPNIAVVHVGDERVDRLSSMYRPRKTIHAAMEFMDFAGGGSTSSGVREGLFSGEGMGLIKNPDALLLVLRNFRNEVLDQGFGPADPLRELESVESELILADQIIAEKRLDRIQADNKRGKKTSLSRQEEKIMKRVLEQLDSGRFIKDLELTHDESSLLSGFRFLTQKQVLAVLNSGEDNYGLNSIIMEKLEAKYPVIEFAGKFEMEISGMDPDDAAEFMKDMGIISSAKDRLTKAAYSLLGYISFFTVGEDEVRAWTIRRGDNALAAAGAIHTDLAKGFIRAECFSYDDLIAGGSEKSVRDKGHFRLEGKDYMVKDGDILNIRFNV